jgi:hypothetical protein
VTGAAAAFRKNILDLARPIPKVLYHDAWLAFMASAVGKVHLLDVPTIQYRIHGSNTVGVEMGKRKQNLLEKARSFYWALNGKNELAKNLDHALSRRTVLYERLSSHPALSPHYKAMASEALQFARRRQALVAKPHNPVGRTIEVLRIAARGHYRKYSAAPWSESLRDILNR